MHRLLSRGGRAAIRNHLLALTDQGTTAFLSLIVILWLIRRGNPDELGAYVFWANAALILSSISASFTSVHLFRLPPAPSPGRRGTEKAILAGALSITAIAAVLSAAATALAPEPFDCAAAALFVPSAVLGNYARALATARGALLQPALISIAPLATVVVGGGIELIIHRGASANMVLTLSGLGQGVMAGIVVARLSPGWPSFSRTSRERWRIIIRRSRWSLLAALGNEVFTRLYIVVVSVRFGAAEIATLTAAQTMLRPATLLAGAFGAAVRDTIARQRHAGDAQGMWRMLLIGAAIPAITTLALGIAVATFWPVISSLAYGGRYPDLQGSVLLWAVVMAISCFWVSGLVGLQALGLLRQITTAELAGAMVCAAVMGPLVWQFSAPAALGATAVGGIVQISLLLTALRAGLERLVGPLGSDRLLHGVQRQPAV